MFNHIKEAPIRDHGTFLLPSFSGSHICEGEEIDLYFKLDVRLNGTTYSLLLAQAPYLLLLGHNAVCLVGKVRPNHQTLMALKETL